MILGLEYIIYFLFLVLCYIFYIRSSFGKHTNIILSTFFMLEGFTILLLGSYLPLFFGLFLFISGLWGLNLEFQKKLTSEMELDFLGMSDNIVSFYPFIGFFGIIMTIMINTIYLKDTYGTNDFISIIFSLVLIFYKLINSHNSILSNVFLLINFFMFIFLVFPRIFLLIINKDIDPFFDYNVVYLALNLPLQKLLSVFGYSAYADMTLLKFHNIDGDFMSVNIGRNCSGLHSVVIFVSAFFTYAIITYRRFDAEIFLFAILGVIISYISNLLRMFIIVLVGIYVDYEAMLWTHHYIGWIIFTIWIFLFWELFTRSYTLTKA